MIDYRVIKQSEVQMAMDFCKEKGFDFPIPYEVAFGAFDDGILIGVCALKKVYQIEPLVTNLKYAGVPQILAEKVMACASLITREVTALVKLPENVELFKRYGFTVRDEDVTSIYKDI